MVEIMLNKLQSINLKWLVYMIDRFFYIQKGVLYGITKIQGKAYQSFRQIPCVSFLCWYTPVPVRSCITVTEHVTVHAYRLEAF